MNNYVVLMGVKNFHKEGIHAKLEKVKPKTYSLEFELSKTTQEIVYL